LILIARDWLPGISFHSKRNYVIFIAIIRVSFLQAHCQKCTTMKTRATTNFFTLNFPLLTVLFCAGVPEGTAQDFSWVTHYSEPSDVRALDITTAPSGANYQLIEHNGALTIGNDTFDGDGRALVRHNSAGTLSWALAASAIQVLGTKATDQHVYLAGTYKSGDFFAGYTFTATAGSNDGFIIRLTSQGIVDMVITISGPDYDDIRGLDVDKNGMMWVTGSGSEALVFGDSATNHPGMRYFMASFDQDGNLHALSRSNAVAGIKITTNSNSGRVFVAANSGEEQPTTNFSGETLTYTSSDFYKGDFFIIAYDGSGKLISTKHHSSTLKRTLANLDATENLDFYVTTEMLGEITARKYDKDLNKKWDVGVPGNYPYSSGMCTDLTGNIYVTGRLPKQGFGGSKGIIVKYSTGGKMLWYTEITPPGDDEINSSAEAVAIDTDHLGDVYITGHFNGKAEFRNNDTYESGGYYDFFVARIAGQSDYTSLTSKTSPSLKVYPAINHGKFTIEFAVPSEGHLTIRDVAGRIVHQTNTVAKSNLQRYDVTLQDGMYFLEFKGHANGAESSRIIIMH
jgi:hypothetical protein